MIHTSDVAAHAGGAAIVAARSGSSATVRRVSCATAAVAADAATVTTTTAGRSIHDEFHVDAEAEPLGELHGGTAGAGGGVLGVPTSSLGCQDWRILCCPIHHPHHPLPNRELLLPPLHLMPRSFLQGGRALPLLEVDSLDVVAEVGPDANVHPLPAAVMWCQNVIR